MIELWEDCQLGDAVQQEVARVGDAPTPVVLSSTKHFGLVPSRSYFRGRQIFGDDLSAYRIVKPQWFAYATNHLAEGSIGLNELHETGCVSPMYTVFSARSHVHQKFLYRLLKSPELINQYQVREQASVDRRGSIRFNSFAEIPIVLPPLEEQRRIAEILDTVDEVFENTKQIISKLELQEYGMKKDLFDRYHETDTGWKQMCVGDLGRVITGSTPPTSDRKYWDGTVPFLTPGDIDSRGNALITERSVTDLGAASGRIVPSGSVAVVCIGSTVGKVGRISMCSVTNQQINCVVPSSDYDSEFVYHILDLLRPSIEAEAGRQAIPIVNAKLLSSLQVWTVPLEQQKIIVDRMNPIRDRIEHELSSLKKYVKLQLALADDLLLGRAHTVTA